MTPRTCFSFSYILCFFLKLLYKKCLLFSGLNVVWVSWGLGFCVCVCVERVLLFASDELLTFQHYYCYYYYGGFKSCFSSRGFHDIDATVALRDPCC